LVVEREVLRHLRKRIRESPWERGIKVDLYYIVFSWKGSGGETFYEEKGGRHHRKKQPQIGGGGEALHWFGRSKGEREGQPPGGGARAFQDPCRRGKEINFSGDNLSSFP